MSASTGPTRLEAGRGVVLAYCCECPPWRRLAADRPEALLAAADHVELVHGDTRRARWMRSNARRHADGVPPPGL